jgi:hypothetical protein
VVEALGFGRDGDGRYLRRKTRARRGPARRAEAGGSPFAALGRMRRSG